MQKKYMWLLTIVTGFTFVFGGLQSVYAQKSDSDEFTLEEITVTAEKRVADVQKTSLSVSVLTGDEVKEKSYTSITSMLENVAGVQIQGSGSGNSSGAKIFIRGIGLNNLDTAYGDPAIALNVDGIQQQRGLALSNSTMDVERVEVLRGPQGTMYGRNATGGAVNIVMVQPKDKFETSARVQLGNYNAQTYEAMANVPVYSKLALRLSGVKDKRDSYMAGSDGYTDTSTYRFKAQYKPVEDMTLIGTVEYRKDQSRNGGSSVTYDVLKNSDDPWSEATTDSSTSSGSSSWTESWSYSLNYVWKMDWATLTFIPAMTDNTLHENLVQTGDQPAQPEPYGNNSQYTYEARLANPDGSKLIWTAGGYLWDSKVSNQSESAYDTTADYFGIMQMDRPTGSYALFGQATYPVTDVLRAVAGIRYSVDNKKQEALVYHNDENGDQDFTKSITYGSKVRKPTYKVGIEYDVAENSMAYAQAASGYKSGGILFDSGMFTWTGTTYVMDDLDNWKYDPETSMSYEIGSKNRFMNDRMQINADIWLTAYKGLQVQEWKYDTVKDTNKMYILNGGRTNTYGAEIEGAYLITADDRVTLNISTMRGEYRDLEVQFDRVNSTTGDYESSTGAIDLDGVTMANMPKLTITPAYTRTFIIGEYGMMSATLDTTYKTKYYNNIQITTDGALVPSHHISNFYLNWTSPQGMWNASANVKNIENKAIAVMAANMGGISLNSPRTYSASLTVKF